MSSQHTTSLRKQSEQRPPIASENEWRGEACMTVFVCVCARVRVRVHVCAACVCVCLRGNRHGNSSTAVSHDASGCHGQKKTFIPRPDPKKSLFSLLFWAQICSIKTTPPSSTHPSPGTIWNKLASGLNAFNSLWRYRATSLTLWVARIISPNSSRLAWFSSKILQFP